MSQLQGWWITLAKVKCPLIQILTYLSTKIWRKKKSLYSKSLAQFKENPIKFMCCIYIFLECCLGMYIDIYSYRVHLKIDQLPSSECNNNLSLVHSTTDNGFFARSLPLIHTFVCSDVTDAIWVHLNEEKKGEGAEYRKCLNSIWSNYIYTTFSCILE